MAKKNEVAIIENFDLQVISEDLKEAIAEEMDGLGTIPFDRIKVPAGGSLAWEIPTEDPDAPESATELVGVILYHHPINAYWKDAFTGGNAQPDCASMDAKKGVDRETGEVKDCASCPYNQFGSAGAGKACKNTHRIYLVREGNPVPYVLTLPPTSLKGFRDYIGKSIIIKGMRSYGVITRITLKKEQNSGNIAYSRAVFTFAGKLTEEQKKAALSMAEAVKETDKNTAIDSADYQVAEEEQDTGFQEIPAGEEQLPFN